MHKRLLIKAELMYVKLNKLKINTVSNHNSYVFVSIWKLNWREFGISYQKHYILLWNCDFIAGITGSIPNSHY